MTRVETFRSTERKGAIAALAETVCRLRDDWSGFDAHVGLATRARSVLLDLFGVTVAGARTPEMFALTSAWRTEAGDTAPLGTTVRTTVRTAAELDAVASCCLELDEGNKYAAGHPAAHVVPAAVAATRLSPTPVSGAAFTAAVVAGYEVAARFGWALDRDARWHTHGHWGATGAAAAAASIMGADASTVAAAIDASAALVHVAPWATVLDGNFARNLWIAGAVRAGLDAAHLAEAGLVHNSGAAVHTFDIVGSLDAARLTDGLGHRWLTLQGYAKRHASCSYTHAAVDTVLGLREHAAWSVDDVESVRVRIHSLASPLFGRHPTTRLAAMFSLPFVVAAAFDTSDGVLGPGALDPSGAPFARAEALSHRITVEASADLDALLPVRRAAEVTVTLTGGEMTAATTPNPVGDIDHFPAGYSSIAAKVERLIGADDAVRVAAVVDALPGSSDVAALLRSV